MEHGRFSIIPARAFDPESGLNAGAILVLGVLGTYSDRDGWCYPSQSTIGDRLGISRQSVIRHLSLLEEKGFITRNSRQRPNGSNTSCMYRVIFDVFNDEPEPEEVLTQGPKEEKSKVNWYPIAEALSEICQVDLGLNKGRLLKEAKDLGGHAPGFSVDVLRRAYGPGGIWYLSDFRGKRGDPPTVQQIKQTWTRYVYQETNDDDMTSTVREGYID